MGEGRLSLGRPGDRRVGKGLETLRVCGWWSLEGGKGLESGKGVRRERGTIYIDRGVRMRIRKGLSMAVDVCQ